MRLFFATIVVMLISFLSPTLVLAETCLPTSVTPANLSKCAAITDKNKCSGECYWSQVNVPEQAKTPAKDKDKIYLDNPLGKTTEISTIVGKAIGSAMGIMGSLALVVFVYGGFRWLTAAGNSESIEAGTGAMVWATIGIFIIFSSYAILQLVFNAIGAK